MHDVGVTAQPGLLRVERREPRTVESVALHGAREVQQVGDPTQPRSVRLRRGGRHPECEPEWRVTMVVTDRAAERDDARIDAPQERAAVGGRE